MDDSIQLLSTMSPKFSKTNKNVIKKRAPTKLALKKTIRRSSIYDKLPSTIQNSNLLISNRLTESSSSNSDRFSKNTDNIIIPDSDEESYKTAKNNDTIIIADSDDDINNEGSLIKKENVQKIESTSITKYNEIENWISNVELEKDVDNDISVFSQISIIHGNSTRNGTQKAINSTFVNKKCPRFDEFLKIKSKDKAKKMKDNVHKENNKNVLNKNKEINELEQEKLLDELYGTDWRKNKSNILPNSEPRKKKIVKTKTMPQTEVKNKSKISITHKNPYLDSERQKSRNLLHNLQQFRIKSNLESPYFNRIKNLGDSESTDNEKTPRIKLNFDSPKNDSFNNFRTKTSSETSSSSGDANKVIKSSKINFNNIQKPTKIIKKTIFDDSLENIDINLTDKLKNHKEKNKKDTNIQGILRCSRLEESFSDLDDDIDTSLEDKLKKKNILMTGSASSGSDLKIIKKSSRISNSSLSDSDVIKTTKISTKIIKNVNKKEINIQEILRCSRLEESFSDFENDIDVALEDKLKKKNILMTGSTSSGSDLKMIKKTTRSSSESDPNDKTKKIGKDLKIKKTKKPTQISSSSDSDPKKVTKTIFDKPIVKKVSKKVAKRIVILDDSSSSSEENYKTPTRIIKGPQSFLASLSRCVSDSNCDASAKIFRNSYNKFRGDLVIKLFNLYNETIFDKCIPDDSPIEWSDRMTGTAGYCYCRKITRRTGAIERKVRFVLSVKVLDSADRLRDTLVHEMCHAATWIVNQVSDGHGQYWKAWASKAMKVYPELPPIKTCHDYVINTKYTYKCKECGYSFGRHSKSLDIERKCCGRCSGKFEILINKTTKSGVKTVQATPKKEASGFALFVKENYATYKNPLIKHGDVMKLLGQKFQELKVYNTK